MPYDVQKTEAKWQKIWEERQSFKAIVDPARPKYYVLSMFPYPSGRIHQVMCAITRWATSSRAASEHRDSTCCIRWAGTPSGCLPKTPRAIAVHPAKWTHDNIDTMRGELKRMGLSIDWSRELATCDVAYYNTSKNCFSISEKPGSFIVKSRRCGIRSTAPCSRTNR